MSLVAYASSDESDEDNVKPIKKQKQSVKITIPSLKEFKDEDDEKPVAKRLKLLSGSGLFSLLPPPKNTPSAEKSGFVPHIFLSKKQKPLSSPDQNKKPAITISTPLKTTSSPTSSLTTSEEQESDDEFVSVKDSSNTTGSCDFFWLDDLASKNADIVENSVSVSAKGNIFPRDLSSQLPCSSSSNIPQTLLNDTKNNMCLQQHQQLPSLNLPHVEGNLIDIPFEQQCQSADVNDVSNSSGSPEETLNEEQFFKLQGRRWEFENIDIIDVKADDQLTNRNEWLMKTVTEEATHRPKKKHGLPTQQQKRKHQITYLAFQAKEREMDLKNQWALNRLTRRETQSKYGF